MGGQDKGEVERGRICRSARRQTKSDAHDNQAGQRCGKPRGQISTLTLPRQKDPGGERDDHIFTVTSDSTLVGKNLYGADATWQANRLPENTRSPTSRQFADRLELSHAISRP